jgi:hypothetical protein
MYWFLSRRDRVTIECVSDPDPEPDPDWIWIQLGLWIRIMNPVRIHAGKNDPKKSFEVSCFEVLNVHFGGLKAFCVA